MTISILEYDYVEPERPYSQKELQYNRDKVFSKLRVGNTRAHHKRCEHFYFVKENGRKENEINKINDCDIGNCSVCWKFNNTPKYLKSRVKNLINSYCSKFYDKPLYLSHYDLELEKVFYKWLYEK